MLTSFEMWVNICNVLFCLDIFIMYIMYIHICANGVLLKKVDKVCYLGDTLDAYVIQQ